MSIFGKLLRTSLTFPLVFTAGVFVACEDESSEKNVAGGHIYAIAFPHRLESKYSLTAFTSCLLFFSVALFVC